MSAAATTAVVEPDARTRSPGHPIASLVLRRLALGLLTLWIVSILIFAATMILPGNAAYAILGHQADPVRLHALEHQLHLDRSVISQYTSWLGNILTGHPGTSLSNGQPVWSVVGPRLANSAVLVLLAGVLGTAIGVGLGVLSALWRDTPFDHALSVASLAVIALPEFVVAIALILLFSTVVAKLLPAVSVIPDGEYAWSKPRLLILPVASLIIVIVPYIYRMTRAAVIEALESDYVEMARLKGLPTKRIVMTHALTNAVAPSIQVIGLSFLYLAGGIVLVEYVFAFPGIGQALVNAVSNRDIPSVQFIVMALAVFYVLVNIVTDVIALLASPRHRLGG